MSARRDSDYLFDIQEAIRRIAEYTAPFSYEQFHNDIRTQDAVIRNLEIIGEAAVSPFQAEVAGCGIVFLYK